MLLEFRYELLFLQVWFCVHPVAFEFVGVVVLHTQYGFPAFGSHFNLFSFTMLPVVSVKLINSCKFN